MTYNIPGIKIRSSGDILGPDTKLAMLIWAASGKGKTQLASTLHKLTLKFDNKPSLLIPLESSDGGGAMTVRKMNIPIFEPKTLDELDKGLAGLKNDKEFGGIILDSSTELAKQLIKPVALAFPCREKGTGQAQTRATGVPTRSDYQTMGELGRQVFQKLLNFTKAEGPYRKHVIVTAADKVAEDDDGKIRFWGPDLPGALADAATQMFQIAGTIEIKPTVEGGGKRSYPRYLCFNTDGPKAIKDRSGVFPTEIRLAGFDGDTNGLDLCDMWEKYWLPEVAKVNGTV